MCLEESLLVGCQSAVAIAIILAALSQAVYEAGSLMSSGEVSHLKSPSEFINVSKVNS